VNRSIALAVLAVSALVTGCQDKSSTSPAASASGSAAAAPSAPAASAPTAAAPAASSAAAPASTVASFPATALPAKKLADYTVGLPPGGKLDKAGDDRASLDTPDYKLMFKISNPKDTAADMKGMVQKLPGFKSLTVDAPDGIVAEFEDKGTKQYIFTRFVKVGDVSLTCDSAMTKPAKDAAKAKEAFEICGTLKKK
jgi:hypothetical protein